MLRANPIADRISRYRAWLEGAPVDRPLVGLLWEPDIPPLPEFLAGIPDGAVVTPDQIRPADFLHAVDGWHARDQLLPGDIVQAYTPAFGFPWVEAIAGCPVIAHPGSLWAHPILASYTDRAPIQMDPQNPWLSKLLEFAQALVDHSGGRFPVALPQMRGPLDTLAAMRTPQQMSIDLIEQPDQVQRILSELTDLWIDIARSALALIPPFHGGCSSRMKMWAPGPAITPQNDVSTLVSPRMYRQMVLPFDEKIMAAFPYHCFHMHGSEYHQVDNLLRLVRLTAIELTLEHTLGGPSLEATLPVVRRILERKPLILAALDVDTAERCIAELPPVRLCLTVAVSGPDIPPDFVAWVAKYHSQRVENRESA